MISRSRRTIHNSLIVGITNLLNNLLMFALLLLLMGYLGDEKFGKYFHATSLGWIFLIASTMGTDAVIIRDLASRREPISQNIGGVVLFRAFLGIISAVALITVAWKFYYPTERFWAIAIYSAGIPLSGLSTVFQGVLASRERFTQKGIILLSSSLVQVLLTLLAIWLQAGWVFIVLSIHLLSILVATVLGGALAYRLSGPWHWGISKPLCRYLVLASAVYGYIYISVNTATRSDALIVQHLYGDATVGSYGAAKRIFEAMVLFMSAFLTEAIFPVISSLHESAPERLRYAYQQAMRYSFLMVAPLALFLMFFSGAIFEWLALKGVGQAGFVQSAPLMVILAAGLLPINWHSLHVRFLFSMKKEKLIILPATGRLITTVLFCWWWGKLYGGAGVAAGWCASLVLEYLCYGALINHYLKGWDAGLVLIRPVLANLLLAAVFFGVRGLSFPLVAAMAAICYPLLVLLTGSMNLKEIVSFLPGRKPSAQTG